MEVCMNNKAIVFLHLSDMHLDTEKDINDKHIEKIIDSIKSYKDISFNNIIIVLSGDLTQSGKQYQFNVAKKLLGTLIRKLNKTFNCKCTLLIVPGNHDVDHNDKPFEISDLNDSSFSRAEISEHKKLESFYSLAKFNHCFQNSEIYFDKKIININGIKIQANLINNAIFSTLSQYKGQLYIPKDKIDVLAEKSDSDFVITVMHHAPDYYMDDIKNHIEDSVIKNSSILFHGHEHYGYEKSVSFDGSNKTIIQMCGKLCEKGNWDESSYCIGVLDIATLQYKNKKFTWNVESNQYEYHKEIINQIERVESPVKIEDDFLDFVNDNDDNYYVFPSIVYHKTTKTDDRMFERFEIFKEELLKYRCSIIVGSSGIGKTTLLKKLFLSFAKDHYVLFASPDKLLDKSANKRQDTQKLIKSLFRDIYGDKESDFQAFEQTDKDNCIFIIDDFEQIYGINIYDFFNSLSIRFGTIIISNVRTIDFDPKNIGLEEIADIAKFEIKAPIGDKRREIIKAVVREKASDKSEKNIDRIVQQIDQVIKTQLNIIPPEPDFLVQITENYMNNIGETIVKSPNVFSKVFEANLTNKIDGILKKGYKNITVDLMYVLFGKIAYYIHFNKAYPIKRSEIDSIVNEYVSDYGDKIETEDIIDIAKSAKILINTEDSKEQFRFSNKSMLAYFVAREIVLKKDTNDLTDIMSKACINICTDILIFIIYLSNDTLLLNEIIKYVKENVLDLSIEFSIPDAVPDFIKNDKTISIKQNTMNGREAKKQIEQSEKVAEEGMVKEFTISDLYDWDDSTIDNINNKLLKMTSLLHIIAKCLPCFEHLLKKPQKKDIIELLFRLPNVIFVFWTKQFEDHYEEIIDELKIHPYFVKKLGKISSKEIDQIARYTFKVNCLNMLLNLYYISVLNASMKNTFQFLNNAEFFDFNASLTYKLEHLMFIEQNQESNEFVSTALKMKGESDNSVFSYLLGSIVQHGLVTRNDSKENTDRLESKFYPKLKSKTPLLVERAKNTRK